MRSSEFFLKVFASIFLIFSVTSCAPRLTLKKESTLVIPEKFLNIPENKENTGIKSWNDFFPNQKLNNLIQIALQNNQEINIAQQEVYIAENEILERKSETVPNLNLGVSGGIEKVGNFTSQGASDKSNQVSENLPIARLGLYSSWEVDIWKKLRNATKAAYFHYLSSVEGRRFLITRLVSEIANTYFELLALDQELEIVDNYIKVLKRIKDILELQKEAAQATALAVKRFYAEVLKNEARLYDLKQKITITENKLNTLVGRFPQSVDRESENLLTLSLPEISIGIPSNLLENRPDIKSASLEVESTKLSLASAKARFYPSFKIEAGAGFEAFNATHFFNTPESLFYGLIGGITAPLLNRRAIKAQYFSANNRQIKALYRYEQTVVNAYAEVLNEMNRVQNLSNVYKFKKDQVQVLNESTKISNILFQAARVDYIEVLLTQRDALEAAVEMIEVRQKQLAAYVGLYRALGGGWRTLTSAGLETNKTASDTQ